MKNENELKPKRTYIKTKKLRKKHTTIKKINKKLNKKITKIPKIQIKTTKQKNQKTELLHKMNVKGFGNRSTIILLLCISLQVVLPMGWKVRSQYSSSENTAEYDRQLIQTLKLNARHWVGNGEIIFHWDGYKKKFKQQNTPKSCKSPCWVTNRQRNKKQHTLNGNRQQQQLKVLHWNAGSKLWCNKLTELECLLTNFKPDLCYIT